MYRIFFPFSLWLFYHWTTKKVSGTVADYVIVDQPGALQVEDPDEHDVQLHSFHTHPGEDGQEQVVEDDRDHVTTDL